MEGILIRPAAADDWPAVAGLLVELGRGVAGGTGDDATHRLRFASRLRTLANVTLVAEAGPGGRVVGVVDMQYHQRLGDHRPQAQVNDLVVTEDARGAGAGSALIERAEELARKRGCFRMALVTATWREDSARFYEDRGWLPYGRWFVKPLVEDVAPGGQPVPDGD